MRVVRSDFFEVFEREFFFSVKRREGCLYFSGWRLVRELGDCRDAVGFVG